MDKNIIDLKKFVSISSTQNDLRECLCSAYGIKDFLDFFFDIQSIGLEKFFLLLKVPKKYKFLYSPIVIIDDESSSAGYSFKHESGMLMFTINESTYSFFIVLENFNGNEDVKIEGRNKINEEFSNQKKLTLIIDYLKLCNPKKDMPCHKVYINNKIDWNKTDLSNFMNEISKLAMRKKIEFLSIYNV